MHEDRMRMLRDGRQEEMRVDIRVDQSTLHFYLRWLAITWTTKGTWTTQQVYDAIAGRPK